MIWWGDKSRIAMAEPTIGHAERSAVMQVLKSGMLAQGARVAEFETNFSCVVPGTHAVAVNSGTSALHLMLKAAGLGPGDEVIVPSFTFAATANAVALTGATPVWVDIEPTYYCIDPGAVEAAITSRTKAIMPVHLYGHPANMPALSVVAERHGLLLFEDAAQAHLASIENRFVGTWGVAAAFSFYPTKNMTTGEGGMVTSNDQSLLRYVKLLRNQGMEKRYENEIVGYNNRMTDISAAIGLAQLKRVAKLTVRRQENARFLSEHLENVVIPSTAANAEHVFHQYTIRIKDGLRSKFAAELRKRGVPCEIYYPTPVHRLRTFGSGLSLSETELAAMECLSIPVHPNLKQSQLHRIAFEVNRVAKAGS